jgi:hypothetical protein
MQWNCSFLGWEFLQELQSLELTTFVSPYRPEMLVSDPGP